MHDRVCRTENDLARHRDTANALRRQFRKPPLQPREHLGQRPLQPARVGSVANRAIGQFHQRVVRHLKVDAVLLKPALLPGQRRLLDVAQNRDQVVASQTLDGADNGEATQKLWNKAVGLEVLNLAAGQRIVVG